MQPAAPEEIASARTDELRAYRQTLDDTELVLLAQQYISVGGLREALELCERDGASQARGLALCEARARFGLGETAAAFEALEALLASEPQDSVAAFYKAQFLAQSGQNAAARAVLRQLTSSAPDFPGALPALAQLTFPGPPYREVLRRLHDGLKPRTYLEIGVEHGATLQLAAHSELVCGVDPVPRRILHKLPEGTRLFHVTSDAFFASDAPAQLFGSHPIDLAFIDGMHLFEFALRDFSNVERYCHAASTVVLHDCLPIAEVAASRQRRTTFWVGDAWRALECLLEERPDLRVSIVPCYPSGLVIIQRLNPGVRACAEELAALQSKYLSRPFPSVGDAWPSHYPVEVNAEPELTRLISSLVRPAPASGRHPEPA